MMWSFLPEGNLVFSTPCLLPLLPRREESLIPPSERGLNVEETGVTLNEKARNRSRLNLFNDNNFQNEFLRRAGERRAVLLEGAPVCQE
jgi:hypothetical protein